MGFLRPGNREVVSACRHRPANLVAAAHASGCILRHAELATAGAARTREPNHANLRASRPDRDKYIAPTEPLSLYAPVASADQCYSLGFSSAGNLPRECRCSRRSIAPCRACAASWLCGVECRTKPPVGNVPVKNILTRSYHDGSLRLHEAIHLGACHRQRVRAGLGQRGLHAKEQRRNREGYSLGHWRSAPDETPWGSSCYRTHCSRSIARADAAGLHGGGR